eukprot:PITA_25164
MLLAFKAFVEKQSGHQMLKLRSDNGGEYVNNKFIKFCTEHGIQLQHIVPYTQQQNGVVERKKHTLKEMANYMLQSKGLSLYFWAEAINCANYILNRTLTKVLKNISPEEAWSSIKQDVSNFRVFGSEAWTHIPDEKHKSLETNYEPSSANVPPLSIPSTSENIPSTYADSEDDNPSSSSWDPSSTPQLPKWARFTRDAAISLAGDPTDQRRTRSQFDRASYLLAQTSANYDPHTFGKVSGHLHWDATMNEEYHSLLANDTWDLVPLLKG